MVPRVIAVNAFMNRRGKATLSAIVKAPNMRGKNIIAPSLTVPNRTQGNAIFRNTRYRIVGTTFNRWHSSSPPCFVHLCDVSSG
jgi:hypothetical protein